MYKVIVIVISVGILFSCGSKREMDNYCRYTSDQLFKEFDSASLDKEFYPTEGVYEVLDKGSNIGVKGLYKFDDTKTLRLYAFLLSDSNDYTFSRRYDSLGNVIDSTGGEVTQWYYRDILPDSTKITFFLYGLNQSYDDINLRIGNTTMKMGLVKSPIFSNILGATVTTILNKGITKLYITGKKTNTCLGVSYPFSDSTELPPWLHFK